jgi:Fe-S-cluster containining protein
MDNRKFECVSGCSDCCIKREYYPTEEFGKIGVLLLPHEVDAVQAQADKNNVAVRILPRIALGRRSPDKIIAFQMMGKNQDGDLCPFLDLESDKRSPHGGFACKIYENRPLACRAYPLLETGKSVTLDSHCKFCSEHRTTSASAQTIRSEAAALQKIKEKMQVTDNSIRVWRYATATGSSDYQGKMFPEGWVIDE